MAEQEIKILITTDATGAISAIRRTEAEHKKALSGMEGGLSGFASRVKANWVNIGLSISAIAGTFYTVKSAFDEFVGKIADEGEELYKFSQQTGISVQNLSGMKYAAEQSETSFEGLLTGTKFLSKAITGMNEEGKNTTGIMKTLGVTAKDPYDALLQVADAFSKMQDGAGKTAMSLQLFGRGGMEMIGFLNQGSAGIKDLQEEAKKLGIVFSDDMAKASDQFNDNIKRLEGSLKGFAISIANQIIPALNELMTALGYGSKSDTLYAQLDWLDREINLLEKGFLGINIKPQMGSITQLQIDKLKKQREELNAVLWDLQTGSTTKTPAPVIPDTKKLGEEAKRALDIFKSIIDTTDQMNKGTEGAFQGIADIVKGRWKTELDIAKMNIEAEKNLLKDRYEQGLVGAKEYFNSLINLEIEQYARETTLIQKSADADKLIIQRRIDDAQALKAQWEGYKTSAEGLKPELGQEAVNEAKKSIESLDTTIINLQGDLSKIDSSTMDKLNESGAKLGITVEAINFKEPIEDLKQYYSEMGKGLELNKEIMDAQKDLADKMGDMTGARDLEVQILQNEIDKKIMVNQKILDEIDGLDELTPALEAEYDAREKLIGIYEGQKAAIPDPSDFAAGAKSGMDEYVDSLEWGYNRGNKMAAEACRSMEGFFEDLFAGKVKLTWKSLLDWMGALFGKLLAQMATMAMAKPVIVPMVQEAGQVAGGLQQGATGAVASAGGLPAAFGQVGSLAMVGGIGGTAGLLGGVTGMLLSHMTIGALGMSSAFVGSALSAGASALGMSVGSFVPIVGTIIGGLIGSLVGKWLGGGKKEYPAFGVQYKGEEEEFGFKGKVGRKMSPDARQAIFDVFDTVRTSLMEVGKMVGGDMTNFYKSWVSKISDIKNKKDFEKTLTAIFAEYTKAMTGVDWTHFKKDGEDLTQTIASIVQTVTTIQAVKDIDVAKIYDEITLETKTYVEQMDDISVDIRDAIAGLKDLSGTDYRTGLENIANMTTEWVKNMVSYMGYLKGLSQSIAEDISATKESFMMETLTREQKIDYYNEKINTLYSQMLTTTDPAQLQTLYNQIMNYIKSGWGIMTEEEKKDFLGPVTEFVDLIGSTLQPKLDLAISDAQTLVENLANDLGSIDWSPLFSLSESASSAASSISGLGSAAESAISALSNAASTTSATALQSGLSYVPYDNFPAILHQGERVLTKAENKGYSGGEPIVLVLDGNIGKLIETAEIRGTNRTLKILKRNPRVVSR
jgi:hypothetical protein